MDFARDGMQRAIVRFRDQAMCVMDKAWRWVHDRSNGPVEHPDAVFIEHAWSDINRLLPIIGALQNELTKATERARIAAAAYDGQQSSQRELEALYQAARDREKTVDDIRREYAYGLFNFYRTIFPQRPIGSYADALVAIEREWGGMRADAVAMADALQAYFNARSSTEPHDTPEYIGAMAEALSAWGRREQGGML